MVEKSAGDDQTGQLSTIMIRSAVDPKYILNVGESSFEQLELQLYRLSGPEPTVLSGTTPENEVFRLDATGMLQASITRKHGCVDVCVAGSKACGVL